MFKALKEIYSKKIKENIIIMSIKARNVIREVKTLNKNKMKTLEQKVQ